MEVTIRMLNTTYPPPITRKIPKGWYFQNPPPKPKPTAEPVPAEDDDLVKTYVILPLLALVVFMFGLCIKCVGWWNEDIRLEDFKDELFYTQPHTLDGLGRRRLQVNLRDKKSPGQNGSANRPSSLLLLTRKVRKITNPDRGSKCEAMEMDSLLESEVRVVVSPGTTNGRNSNAPAEKRNIKNAQQSSSVSNSERRRNGSLERLATRVAERGNRNSDPTTLGQNQNGNVLLAVIERHKQPANGNNGQFHNDIKKNLGHGKIVGGTWSNLPTSSVLTSVSSVTASPSGISTETGYDSAKYPAPSSDEDENSPPVTSSAKSPDDVFVYDGYIEDPFIIDDGYECFLETMLETFHPRTNSLSYESISDDENDPSTSCTTVSGMLSQDSPRLTRNDNQNDHKKLPQSGRRSPIPGTSRSEEFEEFESQKDILELTPDSDIVLGDCLRKSSEPFYKINFTSSDDTLSSDDNHSTSTPDFLKTELFIRENGEESYANNTSRADHVTNVRACDDHVILPTGSDNRPIR